VLRLGARSAYFAFFAVQTSNRYEFLTRVWRDGALFGATAEEAFYVRIDEILNPDSERALGRLNIEIGVRPSYPAEFIIVRIGLWQGGSTVSQG
jgi:hypothetical protein